MPPPSFPKTHFRLRSRAQHLSSLAGLGPLGPRAPYGKVTLDEQACLYARGILPSPHAQIDSSALVLIYYFVPLLLAHPLPTPCLVTALDAVCACALYAADARGHLRLAAPRFESVLILRGADSGTCLLIRFRRRCSCSTCTWPRCNIFAFSYSFNLRPSVIYLLSRVRSTFVHLLRSLPKLYLLCSSRLLCFFPLTLGLLSPSLSASALAGIRTGRALHVQFGAAQQCCPAVRAPKPWSMQLRLLRLVGFNKGGQH